MQVRVQFAARHEGPNGPDREGPREGSVPSALRSTGTELRSMRDTDEPRDDANRRTERHHVHYDPDADDRPSELLVKAVADVADADPLELDPLFRTVDPDVLDEFVGAGGLPDVDGQVSFTYEGYRVTVHPSGLLELVPAD